MAKKIFISVLLVAMIGVLIIGAVNRTLVQSGSSAIYDAAGGGQGQGRGQGGTGRGQGGAGRGQGGAGHSLESGTLPTSYAIPSAPAQAGLYPVEWVTVQGMVTLITPAGIVVDINDDVILQDATPELTIENRAWTYVVEQGFPLKLGDAVQVRVYYDSEGYEAGRITNLTTGKSINIRDESGFPMWAGRR